MILRRLACLIALAAAALAPQNGAAETLVVTVSRPEIAVRSNFSGATLVVFGGIERDGRTVARQGYDLVVTVRGPKLDTVVRRKERVAGLWINRASQRYAVLPGYYAVLASSPVAEVVPASARLNLQVGVDTLVAPSFASSPIEPDAFGEALLQRRVAQGLFDLRGETDVDPGVYFLSRNLFRGSVSLPAEAPIGAYEVDVHLYSGGARLATATTGFRLTKEGFEQRVSALSRQSPVLYGLATVLLAFFTGWVGSVVFRRD